MFAQWWNHPSKHFAECLPVIKPRVTASWGSRVICPAELLCPGLGQLCLMVPPSASVCTVPMSECFREVLNEQLCFCCKRPRLRVLWLQFGEDPVCFFVIHTFYSNSLYFLFRRNSNSAHLRTFFCKPGALACSLSSLGFKYSSPTAYVGYLWAS